MRLIRKKDFIEALEAGRREYHSNYHAMYSSVLDGIVTDPVLMVVPVDDHLVHRGDGVFETFKCVAGHIYNMSAHMDRLWKSAAGISIKPPCSLQETVDIAIETAKAGGKRDCQIRVMFSRGPGSLGVNPYDSPGAQLYIIVSSLCAPFMVRQPGGARAGTSCVPVKHTLLATNKTCNYIPNMLMKKEAVDKCLDFVAAFDSRGFLAEGATENFGIVSRDNRLLFPRLDNILAGTTMLRVIDLAGRLAAETVKEVAYADISTGDIAEAREMLIVGTTIDVVAAVEFDGYRIGTGKPGPVCEKLGELLVRDIRENHNLLTPVIY